MYGKTHVVGAMESEGLILQTPVSSVQFSSVQFSSVQFSSVQLFKDMHAKVTSNGAVGSGGKFSNRLALGARRSRNPVPFVAKHNVEPPVKIQRVRSFGPGR